jgi:hypothetical protein
MGQIIVLPAGEHLNFAPITTSRAFLAFLVEDGALIIVASTIVPVATSPWPSVTAQRAKSSRTAASMNLASSGFCAGLPARWPQIDGIGRNSAFGIRATSRRLSSTVK